MAERRPRDPYRFDELGSLQFERLCVELLRLSLGVSSLEWHSIGPGRALVLPEGVPVPGDRRTLAGPTIVLIAWIRRGRKRADVLGRTALQAREEWPRIGARSFLLLTNAAPDDIAFPDLEVATMGPQELTSLVAASPPVRLRQPSVLGIGAAEDLIAPEALERSTADLDAALELARVFVPTNAYTAAVDVLTRHHFTVLTGPPEMGKTAIARTIGLAALTDGWEVHECIRPDELWARYRREQRQVFIADDAFGSTEYRPDAAERWALELDRVLRAMDERHWLVWTSRPAPLRAGLRRIHREHGVERFPHPAEIHVDASKLDVSEKVLILFRHAKAAALTARAIELVQAEGRTIVSHSHFTPERIRRFVRGRLVEPAGHTGSTRHVAALVAEEIREPTPAMAASFRALSAEHRSLLLALLDTPPGPVPERELVAAFRRHTAAGLNHHPGQLVDRLADHFLRVLDTGGVTWVHPSWRDLVIEELVADPPARQRFIRDSSIEGILLALSTGGGWSGERLLPLLRRDEDWDALADRLAAVVPALDEPDVTRLFGALAEAHVAVPGGDRRELDALASYALELLARRWDRGRVVIPVGLLAAWFGLAERLPQTPVAPELAPTWIELLPTDRVDLDSPPELARFDDWTALAELLNERAPAALRAFGFERHRHTIGAFVEDVRRLVPVKEPAARREVLARILWRVAALVPRLAQTAVAAANRLASVREESELPPTYSPRPISAELRQILDAPPAFAPSDEALVARVLGDL